MESDAEKGRRGDAATELADEAAAEAVLSSSSSRARVPTTLRHAPCVPIREHRASDLQQAIARAASIGDCVELRLDYLAGAEFEEALRLLPELIKECARPVIVTLRPADEGGHREIDSLARISFWIEQFLHSPQRAAFADIELDLAEFIRERESDGWKWLDWSSVICSHHDFSCVPEELEKIYERMAQTPARILKIAARAKDATDCLALFHLLKRAQSEGREMIAVAMGTAGIMTRILAPACGSFLTYGALDTEHETAPGQISAQDLRDLYRIHELNAQTEIMGLMGHPVMHSVSPHMHNRAFAACSLNSVFIPFEVRDAGNFLRRMINPRTREIDWNVRGLSVTAPHKSAVIEHLDSVEKSAEEMGAVNTIVVRGEELEGYNTDAPAFIAPLRERFGSLKDARVALIGAGGAARSALYSLRNDGAEATLFARNVEKARALAEKFGVACEQLNDAKFAGFEAVVNATPLGTCGSAEDETPASADQLKGARLAYDLVYNPSETLFMREARRAGCEIIGGLRMLVAQAAEQFKLWTGNDAPLEIMREAAMRALKEREASASRTSHT